MSKKSLLKNTNSTSDPRELSNSRTWVDFLDQETTEIYASKDEWRERLCYTMMKWSERPTSLEIQQFCTEYKIPYTTLREWLEKYPDIKKSYAAAKLTLACHRRVGSMTKKLDGTYAYRDMHMYDPEWHQVNKYHSDMKKDEEKQAHTFIISGEKPRIISKQDMVDEGNKE